MSQRVQFENIEEMRRTAGIDDTELHDAIRNLQVGDLVRLTLRTTPDRFPGESLVVRITSIKGNLFRGKLAQPKRALLRLGLTAGSLFTFTWEHIHSIATRRPGLTLS